MNINTLRPAGDDKQGQMNDRIRIDKWLWHARIYRTRALARAACASGLIRLNGRRVEKPGIDVKPGDVLTLPQGRDVVVVRISACGIRRGPAMEAQGLYEVLTETVLDTATAPP